jgi:hypothetical protein
MKGFSPSRENFEMTSSKKRANSEEIASISVLSSCFLRVSTVFPPYIEHEGNTEKTRRRYDEIAMDYAVLSEYSKNIMKIL